MAKYSFEFKKKVVLSYLNGEGEYKYLSKTYGVPAKSNIEQWVHNYQTLGDEGLLRSRKNDIYSFGKKLSVVELYLSSEISYQDLALEDELLKLRIENAFLKELRRLRLEDETKMRERQESSTVSEDS